MDANLRPSAMMSNLGDINLDDVDEDLLSVMNELDKETLLANPPSPKGSPSACLKQQFGHTAFRPFQWTIIRSIIEDRRDNCAIMATGYGKSLCFQFPSVFLEGITIVVSPLISLMEDQVLALKVANIPSCFLGSAQTDRSTLDNVRAGEFRLVYVSPEYITANIELLDDLADRLTLIAIDEAHCVSQWGHDFRQCYRSLGRIRMRIPHVPILAVTATATDRVRSDICTSLGLHNPQLLSTGFDRPNLEFIILAKTTIWQDLRSYVYGPNVPKGSIIVYCLTRKMTESVAQVLNSQGVVCAAYHAGLSLKVRKDIHERFVKDQLQVIVATVAFGMGIDKPDVRLVIHYGASKDIESYYQEVGRAGRDGQPARCVMFQAEDDFSTHAMLRSMSTVSQSVSSNLEKLSTQMKKFVRGDMCRRLFILQYFEGPEAQSATRLDCCDNCRRPKTIASDYEGMNDEGQLDFSVDTMRLLQAVDLFQGYCGLGKPIGVLRGSQNKCIAKYHQHALHGVGKFKSESYWKQLAEMLEIEEILTKSRRSLNKGYPVPVVELSSKGQRFLNSSQALWLKPTPQMLQFMRKKYVGTVSSQTPDTPNGNELLAQHTKELQTERLANSLMACRFSLATRYDAMPYMIATNLALQQIAQAQPLNVADLKAANIDGMSDAKIRQFGLDFVECILRERNFLPAIEQNVDDSDMVSLLAINPMVDVRVTECHLRLLPLVREDVSLEQMAAQAGLKESTIANYLILLIKAGHPIYRSDIQRITKLSSQNFDAISAVLPKDVDTLLIITLRVLKDALPSYVTYDQIKMVLAYTQVRQHVRRLGMNFIDPDDDISTESKEGSANDIDSQLQNCDVNEMLEDLNMPTSQVPSTPPHADSSFVIDLGSDFEDEPEAPACKTLPIADLTPEELFMNGDDDEDDIMLGKMIEVVPIQKTIPVQKPKTLPNKRVVYDSGSDDDNAVENTVQISTSSSTAANGPRKLPDWMLELRSPKKIAKIQPSVRKKSPFF